MEWAEDLFTLKKSAKKGRRAAAAAAEAAAKAAASTEASASSGSNSDHKPGSGSSIASIANSLDVDLHIVATNPAGRPPRRTAGWGDEPPAGGRSSNSGGAGKAGGASNAIEQERFGRIATTRLPSPSAVAVDPLLLNMNAATSDPADDGIPYIPDIDDLVADMDFTTSPSEAAAPASQFDGAVTAAAAAHPTRVAAYRELNADLLRSGAFAALDGIDLSLLARCLAPEAALAEPDELWTWDGLFAEVASSASDADGADADTERPSAASEALTA